MLAITDLRSALRVGVHNWRGVGRHAFYVCTLLGVPISYYLYYGIGA